MSQAGVWQPGIQMKASDLGPTRHPPPRAQSLCLVFLELKQVWWAPPHSLHRALFSSDPQNSPVRWPGSIIITILQMGKLRPAGNEP